MRHLTREMVTEQCKANMMDHFLDPRNVRRMEEPDAKAKVADLDSGDFIEVYLAVDGDRIREMTYLVFGCTGAVATASALSQMVPGLRLDQAAAFTDDDVVAWLDGKPENLGKTNLLALRGLHKAISQYRKEGDR